jgi:hypothetical protein
VAHGRLTVCAGRPVTCFEAAAVGPQQTEPIADLVRLGGRVLAGEAGRPEHGLETRGLPAEGRPRGVAGAGRVGSEKPLRTTTYKVYRNCKLKFGLMTGWSSMFVLVGASVLPLDGFAVSPSVSRRGPRSMRHDRRPWRPRPPCQCR